MKKIFFVALLAFAAIFFNFSATSAEDLRFIDANGDTGYYFDMDSVQKIDSQSFIVNFIVIRADKNEMAVASLLINSAQKNYTVQNSKTLSYDLRTELRAETTPRITKSYSDKSLMQETVEIILSEIN